LKVDVLGVLAMSNVADVIGMIIGIFVDAARPRDKVS